ncbi:TIM barrel protein [Roseibacillus persicicus]|uniref:sugar phosphate isomerase/epimerase family protein n=1 Tax=Roseibacillus persicicus TaxID=454148 RepID=UPI00398B0067
MKIHCLLLSLFLSLFSPAWGKEEFEPEFYAFFNGLPELSHQKEAELLKELGYDGISQIYGRDEGLAERVEVYEKAGLKVLSVYMPATDEPVKPQAVQPLANGGFIELTVKKKSPEIVASLRKTAAMAAELNIKVALYPHFGDDIATMDQALALVEEVNHPNLGVMFNLCHFMRSESIDDLEAAIEKAGPRLFSVSTNGADLDGKDWATLIRSLDQGTFPQERLLNALEKIGYTGPVGLQCYNVPGDKKASLQASIKAWRELTGS